MSHLRKFQDHFAKLAVKQGYPSRAVFKLQEANAKWNFIPKHGRVLDLGYFPGSWTLLASEMVGSRGQVTSLDLQPPPTTPFPSQATLLTGDVLEWTPPPEVTNLDAVLSDMAPKTTGHADLDVMQSIELVRAAVDLGRRVIRPGGVVFVKVFKGIGYEELLRDLRTQFKTVSAFKPKSSRKESREVFLYLKGPK